MSQMTPEEKRKFIISTLEWFKLPEKETLYLHTELEKDKNPIITNYLDCYLTPLISTLFKNKRQGALWSNAEGIQFKGLIQLCIQGYLSQTAWDEIWNLLSEDEQIYYSTTRDHGSYPLALAASAGNLAGVKRLNTIYSQLLINYPGRRSTVHLGLDAALSDIPVVLDLEQEANQKLFHYLLQMCVELSTPMESYSANKAKLNKVFHYAVEGVFANEQKTTALVYIFAELCVDYCYNEHRWAVSLLGQFLSKNIDEENFNRFKKYVLGLLNTKYPQDTKAQETLDALVYAEYIEQEQDLEEVIPEAKSSLKRTLLITGIFTALGLVAGAAVGVTLIMTGVFAPVGLGILATTSIGVGVTLGFAGLGFGVATWTQENAMDTAKLEDTFQSNGGLKKLCREEFVENDSPNDQPDFHYGNIFTSKTPITPNVIEEESEYSNII